jgi:hypothetical protein
MIDVNLTGSEVTITTKQGIEEYINTRIARMEEDKAVIKNQLQQQEMLSNQKALSQDIINEKLADIDKITGELSALLPNS